jgi:hypothetical protein
MDEPATTDAPDLDRLGEEIAELSAHLEAATARLLDLIRDFDARGGWGNGFASCAARLSWRVGLDPGAARERVRVARALGSLPLLAGALARGELSYAKVRALTRVARPDTEEMLLKFGLQGTAAHVERLVRGWRLVDRKTERAGLALDERTTMPGWLGEPLDVGYAIDVMYPEATGRPERATRAAGESLPQLATSGRTSSANQVRSSSASARVGAAKLRKKCWAPTAAKAAMSAATSAGRPV